MTKKQVQFSFDRTELDRKTTIYSTTLSKEGLESITVMTKNDPLRHLEEVKDKMQIWLNK